MSIEYAKTFSKNIIIIYKTINIIINLKNPKT